MKLSIARYIYATVHKLILELHKTFAIHEISNCHDDMTSKENEKRMSKVGHSVEISIFFC